MRSHDLFSGSADRSEWRVPSPAILVVSVAILLVITGGAVAYVMSRGNIPTDSRSLCPRDRAPTEIVAILLDPSDPLGEPQKIKLRAILSRVRDRVSRLGLVEMYRLDSLSSSLPKPTLHLCNPGTGEDLNEIYQNPELARRKWQRFADTLMLEVDRQISAAGQRTSPIFEAIQAVAVRAFDQPSFDNRHKKLVIVSDLLQNVPAGLDMYASIPDFDEFQKTPYSAQVRADLADVHVFIVYLNRPFVGTQGRQHMAFWQRYFEYQGAVVDSVEQLFGEK